MPSLVEIDQLTLEISKFVNVFSLFYYYLPLGKEVVVYLNKLEFTSLNKTFLRNLVEIGPFVLDKKNFFKLSNYFYYFLIIPPWERAWPFI